MTKKETAKFIAYDKEGDLEVDAADHCLDYLSNTDSTRNDQLHGVIDSEDSKEILAH